MLCIGYKKMKTKENLPECPDCKSKKWKFFEPYCEDCGNHSGYKCDECDYIVDHVYNDLYDKIYEILDYYGNYDDEN